MKKILLLVTMCGTLLMSCSKSEDDSSTGGGSSNKVKSIGYDGYDAYFTFTYDSKGRISRQVNGEGDDIDYDISYTYEDNKIIITDNQYDGEDAVITLNDDKTIYSITSGSEDERYDYTNYTYNEDGNVTSYTENSKTYYITWDSNGNIVNDGDCEYEYSSNLNNSNVDFNAIFPCLGDCGLYLDCYVFAPLKGEINGMWSKNLVSKSPDYDEEFEYTFSSGRLSKIYYIGGGEKSPAVNVSYY